MKSNNLVLISIIASLGGFLFGYDTGVINGTQYYFSKYFLLDTPEMAALKGWVVASALVGCFIGALLAGTISSRIGRRNSLIISAALFTVSAWGSGLPWFLPDSVDLLVVFRVIGGLGIGIASMNAPTYIAELAPPAKRGKMVTYYQMAIVFGFFAVFVVTYFIGGSGDLQYNLNQGWRVMFWTELIPCALFFVLLFMVPRSPRWLFLSGKLTEAREVLIGIHGHILAEKELDEISDSVKNVPRHGLKDVLKKGVLPIVVIGTVFSGLQQLTGINAVLYYGADIFEKALGFGQEDVLAQQVLLAAVNTLFTVLAMYTVDKLGRKPLIYMGCAGMITGFLMLGISLQQAQVGLVSLIGILLFIASFAMSMGPVVWVMLSEIFPNRYRSMAMSIAVAAQWGMNFVVSQSFPVIVGSETNMSETWNGSLPYFIFVVFITFTILFTYLFLPETKGKSLEQLENIWEK